MKVTKNKLENALEKSIENQKLKNTQEKSDMKKKIKKLLKSPSKSGTRINLRKSKITSKHPLSFGQKLNKLVAFSKKCLIAIPKVISWTSLALGQKSLNCTDPVIQKESKEKSTLEEIFLRFPYIGISISKELDDQSLAKFKGISREMFSFQRNSRYYWIRKVQKHTKNIKNLPESWGKVISKTPLEIIKELVYSLEFYKKNNPFLLHNLYPHHIVAYSGNFELMQYLFNKTENINPKAQLGETPLHEAARKGNFKICQFIIENISNKNPGDDSGRTPLHTAATEGHLEICKLILDNSIGNSKF